MKVNLIQVQAKKKLSSNSIFIWRVVQFLLLFVGLSILFSLLFFPKMGLHAFWDILIPIAPLLLVVATGVWRNVCPLAFTSLIPRHLKISKEKRMSALTNGKLTIASLFLLFFAIPLRHLVFDTNGLVTAFFIIVLAIIAIYMGYNYNWKSGWCSGLCPIHPVEKLYGSNVAITLPNAHCASCKNCVVPCPDSTPKMNPLEAKKNKYYRFAGIFMTGGFPGFIWGWFHVRDYSGMEGFNHLNTIFGFPFFGLLISLLLYLTINSVAKEKHSLLLIKIFSTAAVSIYYWYRIPALFGLGLFPGDGMLIDLSTVLPYWFSDVSRIIVILFFTWFLLIRTNIKQWTIRPPYEKKAKKLFVPV